MKDIKIQSRNLRYSNESRSSIPTVSILNKERVRVREIRHKVEEFENREDEEYEKDELLDELDIEDEVDNYADTEDQEESDVEKEEDFYDRYRRPSSRQQIVKKSSIINSGALKRLIVLLIVAGSIYACYTYVFNSAKIVVNPKIEERSVNGVYEVSKYETVKVDKSVERVLPRSEKQKVISKATGYITIYNNYNSDTQKLIKNTRFESKEGKIFRITESVVVPGKINNAMGKVQVKVSADSVGESYNVGPGRFTIPGLKNSPRFEGFYGESSAPMAGGADSFKQIVSKEDLDIALNEMTIELKESIRAELQKVKKDNYIALKDNVTFNITNNLADFESGGQDKFKVSGSGEIVLISDSGLYASILSKISPDYKNEKVIVTNLDSVKISLAASSTISASSSNPITKQIFVDGKPRFVFQTDYEAFKADLAGRPNIKPQLESEFLPKYTTVKDMSGIISPFWVNTYPKNPNKIEIVEE